MNKYYFTIITIFILCACNSPVTSYKCQLVEALEDSTWEISQWLSVADAPIVTEIINDYSRSADGSNWFASTITNSQEIVSAKWMTTALGTYDLYVNGTLVGDEILKPGFTHHAKTKRSFTYDVTSAMKRERLAENVFSVQVTPGWWADKIVTPSGHQGMIGKKCAFRGVLELTFSDGSKKLFGTNTETWKAGIAGQIKHASIFDGEEYDARELPGYECIKQFTTPEINTEFNGEILPNNGAEIYFRHDLALYPVEAYVWNDVEGNNDTEFGKVVVSNRFDCKSVLSVSPGETLVIDFGQNCAAVPEFVFKAAEGTHLTCVVAELLNDGNGAKNRGMDGPEGSVHRRNLRTPDTAMRIDYTFGTSDQPVHYIPRHTFFGYRYISITATDDVLIEEIHSVPVTSISKECETGKIETGNASINRLIANAIWGQRSNYLSIPTDCPQRNERLGWTADTQVFTETGTYFANTKRFFHKWMQDLRDSQGNEGGFPGVAPLAQYGNEMTRVGWSDAGVIVPWTIWKQFADTDIIDECWDAMDSYMTHINATKYDHNALIAENGNYQWADWLSYEPLESCSGLAFGENGPLPDAIDYWNYLCASYWLIDAKMMKDMAKASGRNIQKYDEMVEEAHKYIKDKFITDEGVFKTSILNTMQTPILFALKNNIVQGEAKARMITRLRENFVNHDNCLQTGFLGTSILMQTLTENGMNDIAYDLLFQRKNPSWLYSVDNGATTIWERWNSYTIETGMGPSGMNSFNHYAYGSVCEWIWETAAGIATATENPGFKHIVMKPQPDRRLGYLKAEYASAAGIIKSEWKYENDLWIWSFTIPDGTSASITLPEETESKEYSAGSYKISKIL